MFNTILLFFSAEVHDVNMPYWLLNAANYMLLTEEEQWYVSLSKVAKNFGVPKSSLYTLVQSRRSGVFDDTDNSAPTETNHEVEGFDNLIDMLSWKYFYVVWHHWWNKII